MAAGAPVRAASPGLARAARPVLSAQHPQGRAPNTSIGPMNNEAHPLAPTAHKWIVAIAMCSGTADQSLDEPSAVLLDAPRDSCPLWLNQLHAPYMHAPPPALCVSGNRKPAAAHTHVPECREWCVSLACLSVLSQRMLDAPARRHGAQRAPPPVFTVSVWSSVCRLTAVVGDCESERLIRWAQHSTICAAPRPTQR